MCTQRKFVVLYVFLQKISQGHGYIYSKQAKVYSFSFSYNLKQVNTKYTVMMIMMMGPMPSHQMAL